MISTSIRFVVVGGLLALLSACGGSSKFDETTPRQFGVQPSPVPSLVPASPTPTTVPTVVPTLVPTVYPTTVPTVVPTNPPSAEPTQTPTVVPTTVPTLVPSALPTVIPTTLPTVTPSVIPTIIPTVIPTPEIPTNYPPVIELNGEDEVTLEVGENFVDPYVAAVTDEEDGNLLADLNVESDLNTQKPGIYRILYEVEDSGGLRAKVGRNITVATPGNRDNSVKAELKVLTRVNGVSPETVYFSAMDSTSDKETDYAGGRDPLAIAWSKLTYHFDFDDTDAGFYDTTGRSRNHQMSGSPRAIHTFYCKGEQDPNWVSGSQACIFDVRVRVKDSLGSYDDASVKVQIQTQEDYYSPSDTVCISASSNWQGCPTGAIHTTSSLELGEWSGKRVLYQRGSTQPYDNIKISLAAKNVTVDTYGVGERPLVYHVQIGPELVSTDSAARAFDKFTRDNKGYVTAGWAYNITVTGLRLGTLDAGHSSTLVTATDLDLDWSATPNIEEFGRAYFASRGNWCSDAYDTPNIDCKNVPYPYGVFFTDMVVKGYRGSLPLINIGCFNGCSMVNSGMAGIEAEISDEHNSRIMGSWGLVVKESWFRGNHLGGPGAKAKLTIRTLGFGDTANQLDPNIDPEDYAAGGYKRGNNLSEVYVPHYASVINNWFNDPEQDDASVSGTFVGMDKYHAYSLMYGNKIFSDTKTVEEGSFAAMGLNGIHVYALHNEIPKEYPPCGTSMTEIENFHDLSKVFVGMDDWSDFGDPKGSQCPRLTVLKSVPATPE